MSLVPPSAHARTAAPALSIDRIEVIALRAGSWILDAHPSGLRCFDVVYLVDGRARFGGEPPVVDRGELAVLHDASHARIEVEPSAELIIVRIPEAAAGSHAPALRAATGRVLAAEQGSSGLVAHVLRALAAQHDLGTEHPIRLAEHVIGLIGLMCLDARDDDSGWRSAMLRDAVDYIEQHLGELDLTPDRIAASQNISTRTLHRLFEREGLTLGAWIRTRRLDRCRADLADPDHAATSVSAIGARWGLWDAAHFSRLFKATYGASPRAYRQAALEGGATAPSLARSA